MRLVILLFLISLTACSTREEKEEKLTEVAEAVKVATADIHSASQKNISGLVNFEETPEALIVTTDIVGLKKNTRLGFHIHQEGICEGPEYKSAGDHFNPHKMNHGGPESTQKHSGDMGNLQTNKDGKAETRIVLKGVTLNEVLGKAVLIHAKPDDLKTQPSGKSGAKIACGLIRAVE